MSNVADERFWKRYVPFWNADSPAPFREISHQKYVVAGTPVSSMLSSLELSLIYALARDHWTGRGAIVDLGCLYGITTHTFASGLQANQTAADKTQRIYAYDLFLAEDYDFYKTPSPTVHGGSLFPDFLRLNSQFLSMIAPCPGDLLKMRWGDVPVEILFVDAAKSWELNNAIVARFFPNLFPGSVVVQQDYLSWYEYWTIVTMEVFADHFRPLYMLYGASSAYLCTKPIPADAVSRLKSISTDEQEWLIDNAIRKAPPDAREAMLCAKAYCLIDHGKPAEARALLDTITARQITKDPAMDFHGCVETNKANLLNLLERDRR